MKYLATLLGGFTLATAAFAEEPRFAERTPLPRYPAEHTMARAGNADQVAWYARPSVERTTSGGYIGGTRLFGNQLFSRGYSAPTGPITNGTFGTDHTGLRGLPRRVFLRESTDPSRGADIARNYRTDGPEVPDPVAAQPLRKAKQESAEHRERK